MTLKSESARLQIKKSKGAMECIRSAFLHHKNMWCKENFSKEPLNGGSQIFIIESEEAMGGTTIASFSFTNRIL